MEIEIDDNFQRMHFLVEMWKVNKQQDCSIRMVTTGQSCSKCKLVQMQLKTQKWLIALVPLQLGEQGVNPHSSEWPPDAHQDILGFDLLYQQQEGQWSIVGPVDHQLWSLCLKESSLMLADSCTIILQQHRIPFSSLLTNTLISYRWQQCPFAQTSSGFVPKPLRQASWPFCETVVATHRGWICHCLALHLWDQRRKRCRSKGSFQVHDKECLSCFWGLLPESLAGSVAKADVLLVHFRLGLEHALQQYLRREHGTHTLRHDSGLRCLLAGLARPGQGHVVTGPPTGCI